jgi:hypothetical protein
MKIVENAEWLVGGSVVKVSEARYLKTVTPSTVLIEGFLLVITFQLNFSLL